MPQVRSWTQWPSGSPTMLYCYETFFHSDLKYLWGWVLFNQRLRRKDKADAMVWVWCQQNLQSTRDAVILECGRHLWTEWSSRLFLSQRTCRPWGSLTGKGFYPVIENNVTSCKYDPIVLTGQKVTICELSRSSEALRFPRNLWSLLIDSHSPWQNLLPDKQQQLPKV